MKGETDSKNWIECPVCTERIYVSEENKMDAYRHDQRCSHSILDDYPAEH